MTAQKEILIVDDEPEYRGRIEKELRSVGYHTVLAHNGEEALVALWEKRHIGLVLLDVRLPVENGFNIYKIIRQDFSDIKIILTGELHRDAQQFLIYDADGYYDKSQHLGSVVDKIDSVFNCGKATLKENDKLKSYLNCV